MKGKHVSPTHAKGLYDIGFDIYFSNTAGHYVSTENLSPEVVLLEIQLPQEPTVNIPNNCQMWPTRKLDIREASKILHIDWVRLREAIDSGKFKVEQDSGVIYKTTIDSLAKAQKIGIFD